MAPVVASPIKFIEAALSNGAGSPFGLSYSDPNQRWLIRKDLLSLLQEFPSFAPSIDTFFHNDGTSTKLLVARACLRVSSIHSDHPFVDPSSGLTSRPYLSTWSHPRCSLSNLARNLVKLFLKDHPFWSSPPSSEGPANPALASKTKALDRLSGMIHYDLAVLRSTGDDELPLLVTKTNRLGLPSEQFFVFLYFVIREIMEHMVFH
ncbi:hypothetical protein CRG98_046767 [Punica granatum]|uniref:Uncharacterized protein n=1 Tax=Punica granatum TaxID=22663 RepID=A0A2I0HMG2_PUNGR|nr:hypothetical protein CRG98_046767 [Punica granatum]